MMTPPWKMKPSVVVPCLGFTISTTSRSKPAVCTRMELCNVHRKFGMLWAEWQLTGLGSAASEYSYRSLCSSSAWSHSRLA